MNWFGAYLLLGLFGYCLFYVFVARKRIREHRERQTDREPRAGDRQQGAIRILLGILNHLVGALLLLAIWPWLAWMEARARLGGTEGEPEEWSEFEVLDLFLLDELTLAEIELRELVDDPLGAAPKLPFGHLYPNWAEFRQLHGDSGTYRRFSGQYVGEWDIAWRYEGYVLLKKDGTRPYILTHRAFLGRNQ